MYVAVVAVLSDALLIKCIQRIRVDLALTPEECLEVMRLNLPRLYYDIVS